MLKGSALPGTDVYQRFAAGGAWRSATRVLAFVLIGCAITACGSHGAHINGTTKFSSQDYGVSASERVTTSKRVKKGGGSFKIGKPYKVRGKWYYPEEDEDYDKVGYASWYGPNFHGRKTANGEIYDQYHLSGAHPTFPLPSYARVTNLQNGHSVTIRINDRGPFVSGRIIDVSSKTADLLEMKQAGTAKVRVQYLGRARMDGRDMRQLMASYSRNGKKPRLAPAGGTVATGVMMALTAPQPAPTPAPAIQVATAGPIESLPKTAIPMPAPERTVVKGSRLPVVTPLPVAMQDTLLPQIGPVPRPRPEIVHDWAAVQHAKPSPLTAYVQQRLQATTAAPMKLILSQNEPLTESRIAASWKRQSVHSRAAH